MRKVKLTKSQLSKALTETGDDERLLGHPIGGSGGPEYNPQTMDQHKKTFRSFNKRTINEGGLQVDYDTFKSEVISFIKHLLQNPMDDILPPFFEKIGVDKQQLIEEMSDVGLITWYSPNGTIKYVAYKENMDEKIDELFGRLSSDDEMLDEDENEDHLKPEEPRTRDYRLIHMNDEIAIFRKGKKAFMFYHRSVPKEKMEPYAEVPIKYTGFKDEEGFADYDKEDFDIDGEVIERYVNDNVQAFDFGYGVEGASNSDDMVVITNKLKKDLYKTYPNDEELKRILDGEDLQTEVTGAAGSSGSFETKLGGDNANNQMVRRTTQYSPSNQINENEEEVATEKKGTVEYQDEMQGEQPFDLNGKRYVYVWVKDEDGDSKMGVYCINDDTVQTFDDFYRDNFKNTNESTDAGGSSGAYVQPKVWAKSPQDMRHGGQAWYPSGQIVDNPMKEDEQKPMFPGGEFVEFDDCVRFNNNNEAEKGGCSQGAKDNVVKTKKGKGGVSSDEGIYNEVAKKTGRSLEEVKEIIENKASGA